MSVLTIFVIVMTFVMVIYKRITPLINAFALQSAFLAARAFKEAFNSASAELYVVASLILLLKVLLMPQMIKKISKKINAGENIGLVVNPMLSAVFAAAFAYMGWVFASDVMGITVFSQAAPLAASLAVMLTGLFLMVFRLKAVAQVLGLLVMENGIFLAAVTLCGHMPFFVEIAIFFDVFVCVLILGMFVYRINSLFTHINLDKLTTLKG